MRNTETPTVSAELSSFDIDVLLTWFDGKNNYGLPTEEDYVLKARLMALKLSLS